MWKRIQENGFIYKGTYTGQYCVVDELYVDSVGPGAPCPECGRPTETVSEENYYFKLSAFTDKLLAYYQQNPGFIRPDTRRNEVIAFVRADCVIFQSAAALSNGASRYQAILNT